MNVIIYTRVSTDEQADRGFSLAHQKEVLERYCSVKNIRVVKHYQEDYSAKTFARPAWKEMETFVAANRMDLDMVLFTKWDRFSRNATEAYQVLARFRKYGVTINSVEQPLDLEESPEAKLMLAFYLAAPEVENDKRSKNVIEGTRRSVKDGYWPFKVPLGYQRCKVNGKATIEPGPKAEIVKWIFEKYASGLIGQRELIIEVRRRFNISISKTNMLAMLKRTTYIAKNYLPAYKKEPASLLNAIHEPIISTEVFNQVQEVISGRLPTQRFPKLANNRFPLRGHLVCPSCGSKLTASSSKGRNRYYDYYHCQAPCKERFKAEDANESVGELLRDISIPEEEFALYSLLVEEELKTYQVESVKTLQHFSNEIADIESKIEQAEERLFLGKLKQHIFDRQVAKLQQRLEYLKNEVQSLDNFDESRIKDLKRCKDLLLRLDYWYDQADIDLKSKLIGSIFPENLVFDGTHYRTILVNPLIRSIRAGMADFNPEKSTKKSTPEGSALLSWSTRART